MVNIGQKFNHLTVISGKRVEKIKGEYRKFITCRCSCGVEREFRLENVVNNRSKSCGCMQYSFGKAEYSDRNKFPKKLQRIRGAMIQRCYNKNHSAFHNYGGRGITIDKEWLTNGPAFYKWCLDNGFKDNLSLDRIDVNKGYGPDNCRFIPFAHQAINKRITVFITVDGISKTIGQWASFYGVSTTAIKKRYKKFGRYDLCLYNNKKVLTCAW